MRTKRHHTILELVRTHPIERHEQLQALLTDAGHEVTQATLSRDLRSLGIAKMPGPNGGARYRAAAKGPDPALAKRNLQAFLDDILRSNNLLVLKTRVGGAQPVALALDQLQVAGILGTVAGDDTVLVVVDERFDPADVTNAILSLAEGG